MSSIGCKFSEATRYMTLDASCAARRPSQLAAMTQPEQGSLARVQAEALARARPASATRALRSLHPAWQPWLIGAKRALRLT